MRRQRAKIPVNRILFVSFFVVCLFDTGCRWVERSDRLVGRTALAVGASVGVLRLVGADAPLGFASRLAVLLAGVVPAPEHAKGHQHAEENEQVLHD